ncbi:MAG: S-layer homology domain-containing protein [Clostridiaceae bacterium]
MTVSGMNIDGLTPATGSTVFMPEIGGNGSVGGDAKVIFFAKTNDFDAAALAAANAEYAAYRDQSKGDSNKDTALGAVTGQGDPSANFRYSYQKSMNDVYGKNTVFNFAVKQDNGSYKNYAFTPSGWEDAGVRLDNAAMTMADDGNTFYMAYTTNQNEVDVYTYTELRDGANVNVTACADKTVRKLYLQKGSIAVDADTGFKKVTMGQAALLRSLVDITDQDGKSGFISGLTGISGAATRDGVYSGTVQKVAFEDPYFGNLKFMNGKLGAVTTGLTNETFDESLVFSPLAVENEDFLLFEMNGQTYVIPEASLSTITADSGTRTGFIVPFFQTDKADGTKGNVTAGVDGEGNISVVYTDTMPNTTNNAVFVTKYDPETRTWGEGRMLAMHKMQVYEDSVSNAWDKDVTETAYYVPDKDGKITSFSFTGLDVALGLKYVAPAEDTPAMKPTLLILAQGTKTELEEQVFIGDRNSTSKAKVMVPKRDGNGRIISSTGYYAVSFGVGEQNVGEGRISFHEDNFVPGAALLPTVSFKNTGDVPIRGGTAANPITVGLYISNKPTGKDGNNEYIYDGTGTELAKWEIYGSIPVGATVTTAASGKDLYTKILPDDLDNRKFYFTVSEDSSYVPIGDCFTYNSLTAKKGFTVPVGNKPELGIEKMTLKTVGVDEQGNIIIEADLLAANRGAAAAEGVYIQFTRQSGVDANGREIYSPVDLRGHKLTISEQKPLEMFGASTDTELQNGILRLWGPDGSDQVKSMYGRSVKGTFKVPASYYCQDSVTRSLNLKAEIFSNASGLMMMDSMGLMSSEHTGEYNDMNNAGYIQMEAETFFTAPGKISVALGTTMRLYVPSVTTRATPPAITVTELSGDLSEPGKKNLGILYYREDGQYLVITPSSEGTGVIRVADTATNSFADIAYVVTAPGSGINIFDDNDIFKWYGANGTGGQAGHDAWKFSAPVPEWGADVSAPYLYNLAEGNKGEYFTFTTMSESIDLFFDGSIELSSTFPGFKPKAVSSSGGNSPVKIFFGTNDSYYPHIVTVKVTSDTARFDKLIETFTKGILLPADDTVSPQIYFSRSIPDTASLMPGAVVPMTVYVIDNSDLAAVTVNGQTPANVIKHGNGFWQFDLSVTANGNITVTAADTAGNSTPRSLTVDWFNKTVSSPDSVPAIDDAWFEKADGTKVPAGSGFINDPQVYIRLTASPADSTVAVGRYNSLSRAFDMINPEKDGRYAVANNGIYSVTARNSSGSFALKMLNMDKLDSTVPVVILSETVSDTRGFTYEILKDSGSVSAIDSVTVNGMALTIPADQTHIIGTFPVAYGGNYVVTARDKAGNAKTASVNIADVKVGITDSSAITAMDSWNRDRNNGSAVIDSSKVTGGKYLESEIKADGTGYKGSYEYAIVKTADAYNGILGTQEAAAYFNALKWQTGLTFGGLEPGVHKVYIRDAAEPSNTVVIGCFETNVGDRSVTFTMKVNAASDPDTADGSVTVTPAGGKSGTGKYQFAITRLKSSNSELADPSTISGWLEADNENDPAAKHTFKNLEKGWYQIDVRDKGLDYNDKGNYSNAAGDRVYVDYCEPDGSQRQLIELNDLVYGDGTVTVTFTDLKTALSSIAERRLVSDNAVNDIILAGSGLFVLIPAGTLSAGDSISDMLVSMEGILPGGSNVVQYTDAEGNEHIVIFSIVSGGKVYYIASAPGKYKIVGKSTALSDIGRHWAEKDIEFIISHGLFNGTGDGRFSPDGPMTRAMFAAVLGRLHGVDESEFTGSSFNDTEAGQWYSAFVQWSAENGIINGYGGGRFGPDDCITREQLCTMLVRYMKYAGIILESTDAQGTFADAGDISDWAADAVELCYRAGLIEGTGNNRFDPKGIATRAQVAAIFKRFIERVIMR